MLCVSPLHEGKHEQIDAATSAIEKSPSNVHLRLARAEVYLQHKELQACTDDLDFALTMAQQSGTMVWLRARLDFAQQHFDASLQYTDQFLSTKLDAQSRNSALVLRAQCLTALSKNELAVAAWTLAIQENPRALPDWYLERAALQSPADAIQGLDQGIQRLGFVVSLLLRAGEYEEQLGRIDAALARIQKLADQSPRKETWLKLQGELLLRADQNERAIKRFTQARDSWLQLSEKRRRTPSMERLLVEIERGLTKGQEKLARKQND